MYCYFLVQLAFYLTDISVSVFYKAETEIVK